MQVRMGLVVLVSVLLSGGAAFGQGAQATPAAAATSLAASAATSGSATFDVASIRPSDMARLQADVQAGKMPNFGVHLNGLRAEFNFQTLRDLMTYAYKVKVYQITGPDWLNSQRFDITARMPDGSTKADAPKMLQALLEDRFKVTIHRETKEHPVMAVLVGKGGPKMKESPGDAPPIDEEAPLKPGEMQMDTVDGPVRMTMNKNFMGATVNMGTKGIVIWNVDTQTMMLHVNSTKTTMVALVDTLSQLMTQMGGVTGGGGRQVVDMTGLKGNYEIALDFSMADLTAQARAQDGNGTGGEGAGAGPATVASDPGGNGATVSAAVEKLGLKLDSRKAPVEQLIVDHAEKTPTDN